MSDGIFRIPIRLGDNLPSFEYSRKIALTTSLQKARRGRDSSPLSYPRTLKNNIYTETNGYHRHGFIQYKSCVRPRSDPFFDKTHVLVVTVTVELIWLLLLNILYSNFVLTPNKFLLGWQDSEEAM